MRSSKNHLQEESRRPWFERWIEYSNCSSQQARVLSCMFLSHETNIMWVELDDAVEREIPKPTLHMPVCHLNCRDRGAKTMLTRQTFHDSTSSSLPREMRDDNDMKEQSRNSMSIIRNPDVKRSFCLCPIDLYGGKPMKMSKSCRGRVGGSRTAGTDLINEHCSQKFVIRCLRSCVKLWLPTSSLGCLIYLRPSSQS